MLPKSKIDLLAAIRRDTHAGMSVRAIAGKYQVSRRTVREQCDELVAAYAMIFDQAVLGRAGQLCRDILDPDARATHGKTSAYRVQGPEPCPTSGNRYAVSDGATSATRSSTRTSSVPPPGRCCETCEQITAAIGLKVSVRRGNGTPSRSGASSRVDGSSTHDCQWGWTCGGPGDRTAGSVPFIRSVSSDCFVQPKRDRVSSATTVNAARDRSVAVPVTTAVLAVRSSNEVRTAGSFADQSRIYRPRPVGLGRLLVVAHVRISSHALQANPIAGVSHARLTERAAGRC
jgi:hypothetical protein